MDLFRENFKQHYARNRAQKQGRRRHRFSYSRRTTVGKRNRKGMFIAIAISTVAIAALVMVAIFVVIPNLTTSTVPVAATATPTPDKHPTDMTSLQKEILLREGGSSTLLKSVSIPSVSGNEIVFSSGNDAIGGIRLNDIFVFNTLDTSGVLQKQKNILLKNDNILQLCINENHIVWYDAKISGGGTIYAYDRKTEAATAIKTCYYGMPTLNLYQNYIAWIEYAGTKDQTVVDKLFIYDLVTGENTTLELFKDSPAGTSSAYIDDKGTLIWAADKPADANSAAAATDTAASDNASSSTGSTSEPAVTSIIKSLKLGETQGDSQITQYDPGMYVHNPMTNGTETIWTDTNDKPGSALWASIGGQAPEKIVDGITQYGIGTDFVAYTQNQILYLYFFEDKRHCKLADNAQLASVKGDKVVWFEVGNEVAQSILKYAVIDN